MFLAGRIKHWPIERLTLRDNPRLHSGADLVEIAVVVESREALVVAKNDHCRFGDSLTSAPTGRS